LWSYQMEMTITISTKGSANRNLSARVYLFSLLGQRIHRNSTIPRWLWLSPDFAIDSGSGNEMAKFCFRGPVAG
jgi:hypothetical protein